MENRGIKLNKENKIWLVCMALLIILAITAGMLSGCGLGEEEPVAPEAETVPEVSETVSDITVSEDTVSENTVPDLESKEGYPGTVMFPSYHFFRVDEVLENREPEIGKDEESSWIEHSDYLKVKGTLYALYRDGEPCYDRIYYPDQELPEGYSVEVTEDYEMVMADMWDHHNTEHQNSRTRFWETNEEVFDAMNGSIALHLVLKNEEGEYKDIIADRAVDAYSYLYKDFSPTNYMHPVEAGMYGIFGSFERQGFKLDDEIRDKLDPSWEEPDAYYTINCFVVLDGQAMDRDVTYTVMY